MKEINMYVRGISRNINDLWHGKYVVLLEYKGKHKTLSGKELHTSSANRMMLKGIIEGIKVLKEPCKINIFTPTYLGFKTKKSPNKDLLDEFVHRCKKEGHTFIEIPSSIKQQELIKILRLIS